MTAYTESKTEQSTLFSRELGQLLHSSSTADPVALLRPILGDVVDKMRRAIGHVRLSDLRRGCIRFQPSAFPSTPKRQRMERRFFGLLLIILGQLRGQQSRAWTKQLWRGRRESWRITPDGEVVRTYVKARRKDGTSGAQGGLAARLGLSVREVDRYLQIAKAAGLIAVWQGPTKDKAKKHFEGGAKYAYAVFQWAAELPQRVRDRIRGRSSALDRAEGAKPRTSAPTPAADVSYDGSALEILAALRGRPSPPS